MEIVNHNIRQVLSSADLVPPPPRGEQAQGLGVAHTVPEEKPGDTTKVVLSPEAENLKNDLQQKFSREHQDKKQKKDETEQQEEEAAVDIPSEIGNHLDINA